MARAGIRRFSEERLQAHSDDIHGHGGSDKPHDPEAYKLKSLVTDVVAVMNEIKVRKAHFLGYSLGGRIGFALAKYAPKRFHSFIIGGANVDEFSQDSVNQWLLLVRKGMDAVIEVFEKSGMKITPQIRAKLLANDTEALAALVLSTEWRASLEYALPDMTVPCLIFVGEADPNYAGANRCARRMHNVEFISFPGLRHLEVISQSHLVLPHITKFLAKTQTCRQIPRI